MQPLFDTGLRVGLRLLYRNGSERHRYMIWSSDRKQVGTSVTSKSYESCKKELPQHEMFFENDLRDEADERLKAFLGPTLR